MSDKLEHISERPALSARRSAGHKGDYGRVLVVGGSCGMIGAVSLAANAALRGGAGLVTFAAPKIIQQSVAVLCPCATSIPLACNDAGEPTPTATRQMADAARRSDVLAVGPGIGTGTGQRHLVRAALEATKPLVLDADGLNNLAKMEGWPARRRCPLILTPHPGEFSRLRGIPVAEIQSYRESSAVAAAREWADQQAIQGPPLALLLKGDGTIVTDGRRIYVNVTGNPGMATGGSGDVLTGLAAALLAQGLAPFESACLAAWAHGRAGDIAAEQLGQVSLTATDILEALPAAMKEAAELQS